MEIKINIPNNHKHDYTRDKFEDFFSRVIADSTGLGACGMYERKIAEMFIKAFSESVEVNNACNCKHNHNSNSDEPCCRCDSRKTNADRIRSMSDEELAEMFDRLDRTCIRDFINHINDDECETRECETCKKEFPILNWLQSPVDDEVSDLENFEVRR